VILGKGTPKQNLIIMEFRLPRIILAVFVGIGMGISGCIMQSLLRNDMASPGTLGISSGSGLFVLIFLLSYRKNREISPSGLILTGVALGSGYGALTTLLTLKLDQNQMEFIQRWSAGSLWGDDWRYLAILVPWTAILCAYALYKSQVLNILNHGNETATGLGTAVKPEFFSG
jgi:ABC-type Fe3+-siderophore transport system permease subunit